MLSGAPPTKTESCDAPWGTGAGAPPFPALWWCEHMCPGWPGHSAWVSGPGEPTSPRLEACAPVGSRGFGLGWRGQPGARVLQSLHLPSQATLPERAAAGGWEGGRYRVPGHFLDTQMASRAWPGGKVTHSSGVRWPANLEVSLGPAQDIGPLVRTKGCGLGCSTPGSGLQAPASLPAVARPQRDPAPVSGAGRSRPLSRPRPARESCRRPRPASLSRVGPHFPAGEGSRAARGRDDAGRAPPRRPAQIAFKTSASPPPTAGQGAGAGRGGRRRHVPPRRPAPRSLSPVPQLRPNFLHIRNGHEPGYSRVLPNRNLHFHRTFSSLGSPSFYLTQPSLAVVEKNF